MSNQLKNKVSEILQNLRAKRAAGVAEANFRGEFRNVITDQSLQVEHLLHELGINGGSSVDGIRNGDSDEVTKRAQLGVVREILLTAVQRGANVRLSAANVQDRRTYQTPEYIAAPVQQGSIEASFYSELIAVNSPATQNVVTVPRIPVQEDMGLKKSSELAKADRTRIVTNSKQVAWSKTKRAIEISDEAVSRNRISLLQIYYEQLGQFIAASLNTDLVTVLTNGDQADLSESAAVIGIETAYQLKYKDLVRAFVRMMRMGLTPTAIVGSEKMTVDLLDMLENKQRQNVGSPLLSFVPQQRLPENLPIYTSGAMSATQFSLVAENAAFAQETSKALTLESDRDIDAQFDLTVASMETGFWNIRREARLVIDTSLQIDFSKTDNVVETTAGSNFFPSWYKPVK